LRGVDGGVKMYFSCSEKSDFVNSAFCRIFEIQFLELQKTIFYSTLSTYFVVVCFVKCWLLKNYILAGVRGVSKITLFLFWGIKFW